MTDMKLTLPEPPKSGGWKEWLKWALIVAALLAGSYGASKPDGVSEAKVKEVVRQELGK